MIQNQGRREFVMFDQDGPGSKGIEATTYMYPFHTHSIARLRTNVIPSFSDSLKLTMPFKEECKVCYVNFGQDTVRISGQLGVTAQVELFSHTPQTASRIPHPAYRKPHTAYRYFI